MGTKVVSEMEYVSNGGRRTWYPVSDDDDRDWLVGEAFVLEERDVLVKQLLQLLSGGSLA
jgi:hypothetical protein